MESSSLEGLETPEVVVLRLDDQVYQFHDSEGVEWHWNASAGMRLIEQNLRPPMEFHPSDHGLDEAQLKRQYPDLNSGYALTTDLTKPILFIPFKDGTSVLIDGWHRLLHAVLKGVPFLLCYELTPAERDSILVLQIPPTEKPSLLLPMPQKKGKYQR